MYEQPTCARAALARLHQRPLMRRQHRRAVQVRIVEDDVARLPAQFGDHRCQVLGRRADHSARGGSATGEVDLANSRMPHEGVTPLSAGGQDVHQTGRQSGFQTQLAEAQGGQGRQLGGLEDNGVPGGKRRCDTGTGDRQCAVPRGDYPDYTVGFPLDEVDVERSTYRGARPGDLVGVAGEMAQEALKHVRGSGERYRYRVVLHVQRGKFVQVLVDGVGEVDQSVATHIDCLRHPLALGCACGVDGAVDVGGTGHRDGRIRESGCRKDVLVRVPGRGDPVPADQQSDWCTGHCAPHSWATRCFCSPIT